MTLLPTFLIRYSPGRGVFDVLEDSGKGQAFVKSFKTEEDAENFTVERSEKLREKYNLKG